MLSQFNTELVDLFNEKYLTPLLLKYYKDPLIIKIFSNGIECYHGSYQQHLVKFIPFGELLNTKEYIIHNNKLYIISDDKFFIYDFHQSPSKNGKFNTLDTVNRRWCKAVKVGLNIMVLNNGYNAEIWDLTEDKFLKKFRGPTMFNHQVEAIIGN